ncbi:MAG TPA: aspartate aminotransferase family protein, partial [Thermoanaerobaculia bacterium]|nr:aspartate aminotransferase family protein [Thermoanaerobaculia bacterium]
FTSGFGAAAIGHRHPRVVAAARRQAGELIHGLGDVAAHPARVELAERLARLAPVDEPQVYSAISGSDAVEVALKTALLASGRPGVLAFTGAYHGLTLGALNATARPEFQRPFRAHLHRHVHRLPFGAAPRDIAALLARRRIGAAIVEPILGRGGVVVPPAGWLAELARLCRRHEVLLIADEILTGCGRTGTFFAVESEGVRPDLLCCGKALGGGFPIAAVVGRREVLSSWSTDGEALHTATFVAHPVACAAALATLEVLRRERLPQRAARLGPAFAARLEDLARSHPRTAVRGRGLLWGLELASGAAARAAAARARGAGLLLLAAGPRGSVLELAPPLSTSERQLAAGLDVLAGAL